MCFGIFKKKVDLVQLEPTSKVEILLGDKVNLLQSLFPNIPLFLTHKHSLANYNDIAVFLAQDQTNKYPYDFPDYVCSDFSFRLMGQFSIPGWADITFGIAWTDIHALNCIITEDKEFYFVEPQSDKILKMLKPTMGERIRFIMI